MSNVRDYIITAVTRCREADIERANDGAPSFIVIDLVVDRNDNSSGLPRFTLCEVNAFWNSLKPEQKDIIRRYRQHKLLNPVRNWSAIVFESSGTLVASRGRYEGGIVREN